MLPPQAAYATERARLMLGCYRRGDANDPDTYVAAIAAVLAIFQPDLIREATDPRTGIQSTEKFSAFMPNSGEVKAFCEAMASQRERIARYRQLPPAEPSIRRPVPFDPVPDQGGKHPAGTILANYDAALQLYGRPIWPFEDNREKPYNTRR